MEVELSASDSENVAVDRKPAVGVGAAGVASASTSNAERLRRKHKKNTRTTSKDGVAPVTPPPKYRSWKNSRRPRSGYGRGLPKKGGAGGKGVWGVPGSELQEEYLEDVYDPNYDSDEVSNGDVEFKQVIIGSESADVVHKTEVVVLEYFEHGDTGAAFEEFLDFASDKYNHVICETIIETAWAHKPSHCEMASVLISELYGRLFNDYDIEKAFERLLKKLPDLLLDTPDAVVLLSKFLARCIADDCMAPCFVDIKDGQDFEDLSTHAKQALHRAGTLLSMKQGMVRLDTIWGIGGGIRPVQSLIRQIQLLLKEYLTSGDLAEAIRCVKELEVPHFHHELVYETLLLSLEAVNSTVEEQLCSFLAELRRSIIVTQDQMDRGFNRVLDNMSDIALDVPLAYIMLDRFMERWQQKFPLDENILKRMPTRGRKRFVSEGDGGAIKDHALKLID